ncbi:MAG: transcriptional regulator [Bacteroidales bacterium]|jgi:transcriptional regulator with XRE-family HTH domain|nr:transcriptional regulator [Bacteroidales bacterium]
MNEKLIHIGELIRQKVEEQGLSITEFARKINCERTDVYYIFKQQTLNTEKLNLISKVLNYDFINEVYMSQKQKESTTYEIKITINLTNINSKEQYENLLSKLNEILIISKKSE